MAVLAGALRDPAWNWGRRGTAVLFAALPAASTLVLSERARGWMKVKLAKHLFEHRYDYRSEWLRFTEALGRSGPQAAPLGDRMVAPLPQSSIRRAACCWSTMPAEASPRRPSGTGRAPIRRSATRKPTRRFWGEVESRGRIIEFEALRRGWGDPVDRSLPVPMWMLEDRCIWAGIPLVHHERLVGHRPACRARIPARARLGGFRPAAHRGPPSR